MKKKLKEVIELYKTMSPGEHTKIEKHLGAYSKNGSKMLEAYKSLRHIETVENLGPDFKFNARTLALLQIELIEFLHHNDLSDSSYIYSLKMQILVLYKRALFNQVIPKLKKLNSLCNKLEYYPGLLFAVDIYRKIIVKSPDKKNTHKKLVLIFKRRKKILQNMLSVYRVGLVRDSICSHTDVYIFTPSRLKKGIHDLADSYKEKQLNDTPTAKYLKSIINQSMCRIRLDLDGYIHHAENGLEINHPENRFTLTENNALAVLSDLVSAYCIKKDYDKAKYYLGKLASAKCFNEFDIAKKTEYYIINNAEILLAKSDFTKGMDFVRQSKKTLDNNSYLIHHIGEFAFIYLAEICIACNEYDDALSWLLKLHELKLSHLRDDAAVIAILLQCIAHAKLKNAELFDYFFRKIKYSVLGKTEAYITILNQICKGLRLHHNGRFAKLRIILPEMYNALVSFGPDVHLSFVMNWLEVEASGIRYDETNKGQRDLNFNF